MSIYCISDIHGHKDEFDEMLEKIAFSDDDELYILGDILDKGPKSAEMLVWATQKAPINQSSNIHFLLGNHEEMARLVLKRDPKELRGYHRDDTWTFNYGLDTLVQLKERTETQWRKEILVPWLYNLKPYKLINVGEDKKPFMLVHAGFHPSHFDVPDYEANYEFENWNVDWGSTNEIYDVGEGFGQQYEQDMIWVRRTWITSKINAPIETVNGHTYVRDDVIDVLKSQGREASGGSGKIAHIGNKHFIDCGCAYSISAKTSNENYNLACLRLDDMKEFYVPVKPYDPPNLY